MNICALATDYDGTLARHGEVSPSTAAAVERLRAHGRKVLLVTGRELPDLYRVCPVMTLFDRIVAENGALIHNPAEGSTRALAEAPPAEFAERLRKENVNPLSVGRVLLATHEQFFTVVQEVIHDLSLPLEISLNKGALMVLPDGINKAAGLRAVLPELDLELAEVAGIGDAENDFSFLSICGLSVAVGNALPELKQKVARVTSATHGAGVEECIDYLLAIQPAKGEAVQNERPKP